MSEDDRPTLLVETDHSPDDVRTFYEVPEAVAERIRPGDDPRTFVQALADLLTTTLEKEGA